MKKNFASYLIIALVFLFLYSCNEDNDPGNIQKGEVEFGFNVKDISNNKSTKAEADPASLVISIEDATGNSVYDTEEVELYNMNGSYISKPLSLLVGDYNLIEFMVIDAEGNVIYASPLEEANLAYLVNDPLPLEFIVNKDETVKLVPEVLSTETLTPEDFGYTTFSFEIVETFDFLISVFAYNETTENFELTDAMLRVSAEGNSIYRDSLQAITNQVTVNDGFDPYVVEVTKEGFETYVDTFTNAELKLYFSSEDNGPLVVILENDDLKSISFVSNQTMAGTINMGMGISIGSNLILNWGDGTIENITVNDNYTTYSHNYTQNGSFTVTIKGDIESIRRLILSNNKIQNIDISDAINIYQLNLSNNRLQNIDLSCNTALQRVYLGSNQLTYLDVSYNTELTILSIWNNHLTNLNLTNNINLQQLDCTGGNNFSSLDLSNNIELVKLDCSHHSLTSIDLSNNVKLEELHLWSNHLTNIDISNNILLKEVWLQENNLSTINIENNNLLETVSLYNNSFSSTSINNILSSILTTVQTNPRTGSLALDNNAPPTGQGLLDKDELINIYGWYVGID